MKENRPLKILTYLLLTVWGLMVLFPFYWMLLTSVKDYGAYNAERIPKFFTLSPTLENYAHAFTEVPLARYFANTVIFTLLTTFIMVAVTVLAAFAFSRLNFRGKNLLFTGFLRSQDLGIGCAVGDGFSFLIFHSSPSSPSASTGLSSSSGQSVAAGGSSSAGSSSARCQSSSGTSPMSGASSSFRR